MSTFSVCRESGIGFGSGGKLDLPWGGWPLISLGSSAGGGWVGAFVFGAGRLLNRRSGKSRVVVPRPVAA